MKIIMNFFGFLILLGNGANGITMVIDGLTYEQLGDVTSQLDANCAAGEIHKIVSPRKTEKCSKNAEKVLFFYLLFFYLLFLDFFSFFILLVFPGFIYFFCPDLFFPSFFPKFSFPQIVFFV